MNYQTILYEVEGRIATITLNRPEKFNTIRPPMPAEIEQALASAEGPHGAVVERDGPFNDYSQGPASGKPQRRERGSGSK